MRLSDLLDRLRLLGLAETEARVYLHLLQQGSSKAGDVAAAVRLPRTDVYRALESLVQRAFVVATLARPRLFEARPVAETFADLRLAEESRVRNVLRVQREIQDAVASLAPAREVQARHPLRVVQGRTDIYRSLERMLLDAARSIRVVSTHAAGMALAQRSGTLELALQRASDGVRVEALVRPPATRDEALHEAATAAGVHFRFVQPSAPVRLVVVDGETLLLWVVSDPSDRLLASGDVALWTRSPDFVAMQERFFESLWREATPPDPPARAVSVRVTPARTSTTRARTAGS